MRTSSATASSCAGPVVDLVLVEDDHVAEAHGGQGESASPVCQVLGIAVAIVVDQFGLVGDQEEGTSGEGPWAAGLLVASGVLAWVGTALGRTRR